MPSLACLADAILHVSVVRSGSVIFSFSVYLGFWLELRLTAAFRAGQV